VRITPDLLFLEITENSLHYCGGRDGRIDRSKKALFFAILGLFLQTKGGFEEQKLDIGVV
jgi:hypothetical protein